MPITYWEVLCRTGRKTCAFVGCHCAVMPTHQHGNKGRGWGRWEDRETIRLMLWRPRLVVSPSYPYATYYICLHAVLLSSLSMHRFSPAFASAFLRWPHPQCSLSQGLPSFYVMLPEIVLIHLILGMPPWVCLRITHYPWCVFVWPI